MYAIEIKLELIQTKLGLSSLWTPSKVAGYKINRQKSVCLNTLAMNNPKRKLRRQFHL